MASNASLMANISVKWNAQVFNDVAVDLSEPVSVLKTQLWTLTGVPPDRQKLMFKGIMKEDVDLRKCGLKNGSKLVLVGTSEGNELQQPKESVVFVEDLTPSQKAKILNEKQIQPLPAGIVNLGNTCYLAAVLQMLNMIDGFDADPEADSPSRRPAADSEANRKIRVALRDFVRLRKSTTEAVPPLILVSTLREAYPQFARRSTVGNSYMQQDAEECLSILLNAMGEVTEKKVAFELESRLECTEAQSSSSSSSPSSSPSPSSPSSTSPSSSLSPPEVGRERGTKLCVYMGSQLAAVDEVGEGLRLFMQTELQKHCPELGRDATYTRHLALASLPPFLVVHFVRFEWKRASGLARTEAGRAKVCRRVAFSRTLDLFSFCSQDLKRVVKVGRDVEAMRREIEASERNGESTKDDLMSGENTKKSPSTSPSSPSSSASRMDEQNKKKAKIGDERDATTASSSSESSSRTDEEGKKNDEEDSSPPSSSTPSSSTPSSSTPSSSSSTSSSTTPLMVKAGDEIPTGNFELMAAVTHQGRTADGGHYVAWTRDPSSLSPSGVSEKGAEDEWLKFDDDKVTRVKWQSIDLTGGRSDFHIAYLLLYKRQTVRPTEDELARQAKTAREAEEAALATAEKKRQEREEAESKAAESEDPESKAAEAKAAEAKAAEAKDPEAKDPEAKDPESKDALPTSGGVDTMKNGVCGGETSGAHDDKTAPTDKRNGVNNEMDQD